MEALFPELFFLSFFAPLILRVGVGLVFLCDAISLSKGVTRDKMRAAWSLLLAILFVVGFITQLAAIAGIIYVLMMFFSKHPTSNFGKRSTVVLAVFILLSLIITGAGALAVDLPY